MLISLKANLLRVDVEFDQLRALIEILGCKASCLSITYLNLPIMPWKGHESSMEPSIERMERKLSSWKSIDLSLAGRITLIKSALSNLPIYFLFLFKCLIEVAARIEKL